MFILGLTGSIGMGKSTVARMFFERGVPVHDADAEVHRLYRGAAVGPVGEAFPDAVVDGAVDRAILSSLVVGKEDEMRRLERIVHPLVRHAELEFLGACQRRGERIAVLEIPLLLETGGDRRVDAVAVVSAGAEAQRRRVLARPGMDEAKFLKILARQMSDEEKRRRAHFVIDTSAAVEETAKDVEDILLALAGCSGSFYPGQGAADEQTRGSSSA